MYYKYQGWRGCQIYTMDELICDLEIRKFVVECKEKAIRSGVDLEDAYLDLRGFKWAMHGGDYQYYYRVMGAALLEDDKEKSPKQIADHGTHGMHLMLCFLDYEKKGAQMHEKDREAVREILGNFRERVGAEGSLRRQIAEFVNRPDAYKRFDEEVHENILGQPNLSEITYNVFIWLRGLATGAEQKHNAMIAAPSGCGKTETYRVIKKILNREIGKIPVLQTDVTKLTTEGFKGKDTVDLLAPLFSDSVNGIGIVVLDEIDKKLLPRYTQDGENVNADVQGSLLTVIEGTELSEKKGDRKINTANTLFIAAGAFQQLRDEKKKKAENRQIGFGEKGEARPEESDDITAEDILEGGAMDEFIGRFSTLINLYRLDRDSVATIVRRYTAEFEKEMGCSIEITEAAIDQLYEIYSESKFGCRILKTTMWRRLSPIGIRMERERGAGGRSTFSILYDRDEVSCRQLEEPEMETE